MKNFFLTGLALLAATTTLLAGNPKAVAEKTYKVDATESKIKWVAKKVTGEHFGYIAFKSGEISHNGTQITKGKAVVDMNTITCTDIEKADMAEKLVGHLKAADFFDVAKFQTSEFSLTSITPIAGAKDKDNNYTVKGTLTIKGVSNAIEFPARVEMKGASMIIRADVTFDRTKYGIKYGSASVFEGIGDKAIYDDVFLGMLIVAKAN